jgi:23S rRNA (uracil1939-C5)-methyltransferase
VHLAAGDDDVVVGFDDASGRPLEPEEQVTHRTVARVRHRIGARTFFQGNERLVGELVEVALAGLAERTPGMEHEALDLYCGSGLFALPLSRIFTRVLGVEGDARAVELARINAADNAIENVRFECEDVRSHLHRARRMLQPSVVLLDPPRRGAGTDVVDAVAGLGPEEVRYVSCDPATLARDLQRFALRGYALSSITALDLFPQTPHVECVAALRRVT